MSRPRLEVIGAALLGVLVWGGLTWLMLHAG